MKKPALFLAVFFVPALIGFFAQAQTLPGKYATSWYGNTFGGAPNNKHVKNWIGSMYVRGDGTVFTNAYWDEGIAEGGVYKNGDMIGYLGSNEGGGHKPMDGSSVTANDTYVWVSGDNRGVRKYNATSYNYISSILGVESGSGDLETSVTGLAVYGSELFACDFTSNKVKVYNTSTNAAIRNFTVSRPGPMAIDASGNLWILQVASGQEMNGFCDKVLCYSNTGSLLKTLNFANGVMAYGIAIDKSANKLYIADGGSNSQIQIYNNINNTPSFFGSIGTTGGILSGTPGEVSSLKFNFPSNVGVDVSGNIYVGCDGLNAKLLNNRLEQDGFGTELRCFNASESLLWELYGLTFVDVGCFDPASDGTVIYTKGERYVMDYSKGSGQEWTYKGFLLNTIKYPDDKRQSYTTPYIKRLNGNQVYMYLTDMVSSNFSIYRFNSETDGETAIPCGIFSQWGDEHWIDINGNGQVDANENNKPTNLPEREIWARDVDDEGTIWLALGSNTIYKFPIESINSFGVPVYPTEGEISSVPPIFTDLRRIQYDVENDAMYLSGFTKEIPNNANLWKDAGSVLARYNNWSKGNRKAAYTLNLPFDGKEFGVNAMSFDVEKDYIFVVTLAGKAKTWVFNVADGTLAGSMLPDKTLTGGVENTGWVDIPYGIKAFKRSNGEYLVSVEEDWDAKVLLYRWCPTGDCITSDMHANLTSPENNKTVVNYSAISLEAEITSDTSEISKVEFYANDSLIGQSISAPFHYDWNTNKTGYFKVLAKATSTGGVMAYSSSSIIKIIDGSPNIELLLDQNTYSFIDSIVLKPIVSDFDGTVESVVFYADDSVLFADTDSAFSFTWKNLPLGYHLLRAKVIDNDGKTSWSNSITIQVNEWTVIDDSNPGWTWSGYAFDNCGTCYGGSAHSTDKVDDFGQYTFKGSYLQAYCETWEGGGSIEIFIDGMSNGIFPQNIPPYGGAQKFATIAGLANETHKVKFVSTGTNWTGIDYIRISEIEPIESSLTGTFGFNYTSVNLSIETADWRHFANNDQKAGGDKSNSISTFQAIGGMASVYADDLRKISWTDGTPTINGTDNTTRQAISGIGNGFSFSVKAENDADTLAVYLSGNGAGGTLTAHLSNNSASDFEKTVATNRTGKWDGIFTLIYNAGEAEKTLDIKWVQATEKGSIGLQAASISGKTITSSGYIVDKSPDIQVYPNPARDLVTIDFANSRKPELALVKIVDLAGNKVYESSGTAASMKIRTAHFPKGVYILNIIQGKENFNSKLIIE